MLLIFSCSAAMICLPSGVFPDEQSTQSPNCLVQRSSCACKATPEPPLEELAGGLANVAPNAMLMTVIHDGDLAWSQKSDQPYAVARKICVADQVLGQVSGR